MYDVHVPAVPSCASFWVLAAAFGVRDISNYNSERSCRLELGEWSMLTIPRLAWLAAWEGKHHASSQSGVVCGVYHDPIILRTAGNILRTSDVKGREWVRNGTWKNEEERRSMVRWGGKLVNCITILYHPVDLFMVS